MDSMLARAIWTVETEPVTANQPSSSASDMSPDVLDGNVAFLTSYDKQLCPKDTSSQSFEATRTGLMQTGGARRADGLSNMSAMPPLIM